MPASFPDDPTYWRERADEARALAELMRYPHTKSAMLNVAEGYEKLAERAAEGATRPRSAD
jgi:hypothetical protein